MGFRKVTIKTSAAESIASISYFIESKGLLSTAEKFSEAVYDYFLKLADVRRSYAICREPSRAVLGYKCISYKKKYTIVFIETEKELIICEFVSSKKLNW